MRQSRVFVDGALIGLVDNPDLVSRLREMRRCGRISSEINISYKEFNNDVICPHRPGQGTPAADRGSRGFTRGNRKRISNAFGTVGSP